eukprot:4003934-Pleurochrysis_carterae.AAC.7
MVSASAVWWARFNQRAVETLCFLHIRVPGASVRSASSYMQPALVTTSTATAASLENDLMTCKAYYVYIQQACWVLQNVLNTRSPAKASSRARDMKLSVYERKSTGQRARRVCARATCTRCVRAQHQLHSSARPRARLASFCKQVAKRRRRCQKHATYIVCMHASV